MTNDIQLELAKSGDFLGVECSFYKDKNNNIYMTREQVGKALQYSNPQKGIDNLHSRNKDRLNKLSVSIQGKYFIPFIIKVLFTRAKYSIIDISYRGNHKQE